MAHVRIGSSGGALNAVHQEPPRKRLRAEMVEINDRGVHFRSWIAYAKALGAEVKCLQQLSSDNVVEAGFKAFKKEAEG